MGCGGGKQKVATNNTKPIETSPKPNIVQQQPDTTPSKPLTPVKIPKEKKIYDENHIFYPENSHSVKVEEMDLEDVEAIPMGSSSAYPITQDPFSAPRNPQTRYIQPDVSSIRPSYTSAPVPYLLDIDAGQIDIFTTANFTSQSIKHPQISRGSRAIFYAPDSIIITGGTEDSSATLILKLESRSISTAGPLIEGRYDHCMVTYNTSPMVIGGMADSELASCEIFISKTWTPIASLNKPRSLCSAIELEGKVYVCGGLRERSMEVYEDGVWRLLDVILPVPLSRVGLAPTIGSTFIITGGEQAGVNYSLLTWEIDLRKKILKEKQNLPEMAWFLNCGTYKENGAVIYGAGRGYLYDAHDNLWNVIL